MQFNVRLLDMARCGRETCPRRDQSGAACQNQTLRQAAALFENAIKAELSTLLSWIMMASTLLRQDQFSPSSLVLAASAVLPILFGITRLLRKPKRPFQVPKHTERVLILGATSGIGREIAHQYAERGARICIVGRRENLLDEVVSECQGIIAARKSGHGHAGMRCFGVKADFANVEEMVRVRSFVEEGAYILPLLIHPFN